MNTTFFTNILTNKYLTEERKYFLLLIVHIALGFIFYKNRSLGVFYGMLIVILGFLYVVSKKNKNHEILQVIAYFIGSEVLLRMTHSLNYEFAKYSIIAFAALGMFYSGFSKKALPYWIYLLALFPSIIFENDITHLSRYSLRPIIFDLLGPICLGVIAIYCFDKKLPFKTLNSIVFAIGLPILSTAVFVFLFSPEISGNLTGVDSNLKFSGGYGPNQVATALGLGMFVFFTQFVLNSATKIRFFTNLLIISLICYVGLLTFSRGGMITGGFVCLVFSVAVYRHSQAYGKAKSKQGFLYFIGIFIATIALISYQTDGLIEKRYTNRDHLGRMKRDKATDRKELAKEEIKLFIKNPILGIGVAKGNQIREVTLGKKINSHDEITRLLAEHGLFGLLNIVILISIPVFLFFKSRGNIFLATFFAFWFLTINHSSMRIAAPTVLYALMLLKVKIGEESFFTKQETLPQKVSSI